MGDADRAVEPGPDNVPDNVSDNVSDSGDDNSDEHNGDRAGARRPEVSALVAKLQDGVDELRALPLEGVPPALGDRPWP
jgi:hypothetical protein